ncbi:MAG: penicillin-binding protein 2 [Pseudomonadaceae bacterium]|nr:penicillin-binding protein 2 [Pseudomonadaceae bacterium]
MAWWNKPKRGAETPKPFAFQRKGQPVQRHRVKVRHQQGYRVPERAEVYGKGVQLRAMVVVFALCLLMGSMAVQLAYVAVMPATEPRVSIREMPKEALRRGDIYDRNGVLLATTLKTYSLYADPKRVLDANEIARAVPKVLPDVKAQRIRRLLADPSRRFVWLKRRLTPAEAQQVHTLGLPGLGFREEFVRVYPQQKVASHVLGAVDVDSNGLAGVERKFNDSLRKGEDLQLAIDVRAQDILASSVKEVLDKSEAKSGWGVVMDARTGEIVAMVSLPDYDPNHFGNYPDEARFNRAVLASYEMGSTFKIFTLAQGLAAGHITPATQIDCREPIHIGRYTIKDYHAKGKVLTATEIIRYSSNIGASKIADMGGPEEQQDFMRKLGMLQPLDIGVAEVGPVRYPDNWGRIQTFTISFGHGMMVTPMHLVAAVAALTTDGYYRVPSVVKGGSGQPSHKVVDMRTVRDVRDLMRDVVTSGSGRNAQVAGYDVGGKTGTAEKATAHGYSGTKNVVSFVAAVPMEQPKYVTLVMLDEPKRGYHTGGLAAAPAVGQFIQRMGMLAGLQPDMGKVAAERLALERKAGVRHTTAAKPHAVAMQDRAQPQPRGEVHEAFRAAGIVD